MATNFVVWKCFVCVGGVCVRVCVCVVHVCGVWTCVCVWCLCVCLCVCCGVCVCGLIPVQRTKKELCDVCLWRPVHGTVCSCVHFGTRVPGFSPLCRGHYSHTCSVYLWLMVANTSGHLSLDTELGFCCSPPYHRKWPRWFFCKQEHKQRSLSGTYHEVPDLGTEFKTKENS